MSDTNSEAQTSVTEAEQPGKALSDELLAMDTHARANHGVGLPSLLAQLVQQGTGIDLHPRTVKDQTEGAAKDATTLVIGPGAPRA